MTAVETHSEEWHAVRQSGIGSSEIATIAGIGRFGSRYRIWAEKVGILRPDPTEASEAMVTGRELEPWLAAQFAFHTGLVPAGEQMMLRSRTVDWARTTIDAVLFESEATAEVGTLEDAVGCLELKYDDRGGPWCSECGRDDVCRHPVVPDYYAAQAQWHMFVGDWPVCFFGVLHRFGRYRIYQLDRDEADIAALANAGAWFWELVEARTPPPLDGSEDTAAAITAAHPEPTVESVDLTGMAATIDQLRAAKAEQKRQAEVVATMENELRLALGDAEVGLVAGAPAVTWKARRTTRVDVKALRADHPDIADAYEAVSTTRTLLIKEPKK